MSGESTPLAAVVGVGPAHLAGLIFDLARAGVTVACAESLTGGLLSAVLTEIPGSSEVVRGGLVVYATDLKHSLAGVDQVLLDERGPVDPDVAVALAWGVRSACRSTVGIGLTGVAGPDAQNGVAVGTWYVALVGGPPSADDVEQRTTHLSVGNRADAIGRAEIRHAAVRAAIALLSDLVGR